MDITKFDQVSACNTPAELVLMHADGIKETGITLKVVGRYADKVQKTLSRMEREAQGRLATEMQKQRGAKDIMLASLKITDTPEQAIKKDAERAACRVVGWDGPDQEFTEELAISLFTKNPDFAKQVVEFSDALGNFTS